MSPKQSKSNASNEESASFLGLTEELKINLLTSLENNEPSQYRLTLPDLI